MQITKNEFVIMNKLYLLNINILVKLISIDFLEKLVQWEIVVYVKYVVLKENGLVHCALLTKKVKTSTSIITPYFYHFKISFELHEDDHGQIKFQPLYKSCNVIRIPPHLWLSYKNISVVCKINF